MKEEKSTNENSPAEYLLCIKDLYSMDGELWNKAGLSYKIIKEEKDHYVISDRPTDDCDDHHIDRGKTYNEYFVMALKSESSSSSSKFKIRDGGFSIQDIMKADPMAELSYCINSFVDYAIKTVGFLHHYNDLKEVCNIIGLFEEPLDKDDLIDDIDFLFLLDKGFVEEIKEVKEPKGFEPFEFKWKINTKEELESLCCRLAIGMETINNVIKLTGIDLKCEHEFQEEMDYLIKYFNE